MDQAFSAPGPAGASGGTAARYGLFAAAGLFLLTAVRLYANAHPAGAVALLVLASVTALEGATNRRAGARATHRSVLALLVGLALAALMWAVLG